MSTYSLDFGAKGRRDQIASSLRRIVNDAVDSVGLGIAASACGCTPPELREAIDGGKKKGRGRRLPLEWAIAVADVAGADYRSAIFSVLLDPFGLEPRPAKPMSDAEYIVYLEERVIERHGHSGRETVASARREARRG